MVTSYYIMKLSNTTKSIDIGGHYDDIEVGSEYLKEVFKKNTPKCRICLRDGFLPICDNDNNLEITQALQLITNNNTKLKEYPKHLCDMCFKFIRNLVMIKKIAQKSEQLLQKHFNLKNEDSISSKIVTHRLQYANKRKHRYMENIDNENISNDTKIQCPICKKIVTKSYYTIHRTMHDPDHEKYVCDICGKTFRLRVGYHNHRLRHRTDYPYTCHLCPFKGRYAERLKSHMRTHTGEYRYMCTECPARFLFKGNLNSHVLLKHRDPQYNCDKCNKAFHTKLKLQRHYEVDHLGIKSHECNICGRTYGYRNAMMKHQRRVHKREKLRFNFSSTQQEIK